MTQLGAVLLAGGESRRMGQDKATLTLIYKDRPLWRNQLDLLQKVDPIELFVSARSDPAWRPAGVTFVADRPPSRGPLSGLTAALDRMTGTHLLALAVDMPCMTGAYLRSLCTMVTPGCGVLPMIGERAEPLVAIYPLGAFCSFSDALNGADFSLQRIVAQLVKAGMLRALPVRAEEKALFHNMNELAALSDVSRSESLRLDL